MEQKVYGRVHCSTRVTTKQPPSNEKTAISSTEASGGHHEPVS